MTAPTYPDTISVRYQTIGHWHDLIRSTALSTFTTSSFPDGTLLISAEVTGADPARTLGMFIGRHTSYLAERLDRHPDDQLPFLDVSVDGRAGYMWRTRGVWVQLWHHDQPATPASSAPLVDNHDKEGAA